MQANTPHPVDSIEFSKLKPPLYICLEVVPDLVLPSRCPFGGVFELDYDEGVSISSSVTYNEVFWFPSFSHDLMINDIPTGSGEPVRKDAIVSDMELSSVALEPRL